jgi:NAD(P)-dependent dehydrogenase (short-subunit alcohol dehydrogenase family)
VKALLKTPSPNSEDGGAPYHIYLGTRDLEKGKKAAESLTADHGNTVSALQIDTISDSSISSAVSTVKSDAGRIDILINNVGIIYEEKDRVSNLRTTLETNVVATYAVSEAFKPLLLAQPSSGKKTKRIINVTSDLGSITWRSDPKNYAYNIPNSEYRMSKAAMNMMTACQSWELKEHDVKVFAFNPGYTITELSGPVELRRQQGAWEADVPGKACAKIVAGERDHEAGLMVQVEGTVPW